MASREVIGTFVFSSWQTCLIMAPLRSQSPELGGWVGGGLEPAVSLSILSLRCNPRLETAWIIFGSPASSIEVMEVSRKCFGDKWIDSKWMNILPYFLVELVSMFPGTPGEEVNPLIHSCKSLDSILQCTEHFHPHCFWSRPQGHSETWGMCLPASFFGWRTCVLETFKAIHSGSCWIETRNPSLDFPHS